MTQRLRYINSEYFLTEAVYADYDFFLLFLKKKLFYAQFYSYQSELQDIRPRLPQLEHHVYYSMPYSVKMFTAKPVHDFYEKVLFWTLCGPHSIVETVLYTALRSNCCVNQKLK